MAGPGAEKRSVRRVEISRFCVEFVLVGFYISLCLSVCLCLCVWVSVRVCLFFWRQLISQRGLFIRQFMEIHEIMGVPPF